MALQIELAGYTLAAGNILQIYCVIDTVSALLQILTILPAYGEALLANGDTSSQFDFGHALLLELQTGTEMKHEWED